jgi:2-Cys peroxiredoxin 5
MRGIDEVLVYCVNDGAVMKAWAENQEVDGSMLTFLGDPSRALTDALDMVLDHPGPMGVLGYKRCKRFALYIVDGVIKVVRVSEGPDDPAGDEDPSATLADAMLAAIDDLKDEL